MARSKKATAGLSKLSLEDLKVAMLRSRKKMNALIKIRDSMEQKLAQLNSQIAEFEALFSGQSISTRRGRGAAGGLPGIRHTARGPRARRGGRGRRASAGGPPAPGTLAAALHELLKTQTLRVRDAVSALKESGYKSKAKNLRTMVNLVLSKNKHLFRKKGRGKYASI